MRDVATRGYRALHDRGSRRVFTDTTRELLERWVAPQLEATFGDRLLDEKVLKRVCGSTNSFFEYYDSAESYTLDLPTTADGYSGGERERMTETYASGMRIDPPYVCAVTDVNLVGPDALAIRDGMYVFENSLESTKRVAMSNLVALGKGTPPVRSRWVAPDQEFDSVVSLVGPWAGNYTHWFQDYLTRLEGLEYYRERTDDDPAILIPAGASSWMREALRAVGYDPENCIEWDGGRAKVRRLVVPSVRRETRERAPHRRIIYSPTGISWVRDRILDGIDPERTISHSDRVYLSRSNAFTRRVRNHETVMALLSDWGFDRYRPEELSFAEQVTLFSNAEAIVSPHGSGLMNQIFAKDATVIELMGKKQTITSPATEYFYAELLGHEYGCVSGEAIGPDLRTNVSDLETVLEKLLTEP